MQRNSRETTAGASKRNAIRAKPQRERRNQGPVPPPRAVAVSNQFLYSERKNPIVQALFGEQIPCWCTGWHATRWYKDTKRRPDSAMRICKTSARSLTTHRLAPSHERAQVCARTHTQRQTQAYMHTCTRASTSKRWAEQAIKLYSRELNHPAPVVEI